MLPKAAICSIFLTCYLLLQACGQGGGSSHSAKSIPGTRIVKRGLSHPWELVWGPDNQIWFTERDGRISRIDPRSGETSFSFEIKEVVSRGEGGLLGLALDPDFLRNGFLYLVYDYNGTKGYTEKLVRYTFRDRALRDPFVLIDHIEAAGIHNGSRLWISRDSEPKIFMSTGDASDQSLPQQTGTRNGKILRLNLNGSIPADNPFPGNPVWSYGHRNPQGLVAANGILYASEHGPTEEDEVNIIEKGRNYGWPDVEGPCNGSESDFCKTHQVKEPIWSSGSGTIAVCGLDYYNHDLIPEWKNSLLMLTLKNSSLRQLRLSADGKSVVQTNTWYKDTWGRLRDLCVSPDGKVYLCSSNGSNDVIVEITGLNH